jgi:hypothetical protein
METPNTSLPAENILDSLGGITLPPSSVVLDTPAPSASGHTGVTTSIEERALRLLGSGISSEAVAGALGVTPGRIAQLLSEEVFAGKVSEQRYNNLQKHNLRDEAYDSLEDSLLTKLKNQAVFLMKPMETAKVLSVLNAAKRRGQSAPDQTINQQNIVNVILPAIIQERFTINPNNQVTRAGDQDLYTMPSSNLLKKVEQAQELRIEQTQEQDNPSLTENLESCTDLEEQKSI